MSCPTTKYQPSRYIKREREFVREEKEEERKSVRERERDRER